MQIGFFLTRRSIPFLDVDDIVILRRRILFK
jgi:hypothetical protein